MRKSLIVTLLVVAVGVLSAVTAILMSRPAGDADTSPRENPSGCGAAGADRQTALAGHAPSREAGMDSTTASSPSNGDDGHSSKGGTDPSRSDLDVPDVEDEPSFADAFMSEFHRLATESAWVELERHIITGIREAPDLEEFLPVLLGSLSSVQDQIDYDSGGRGVQFGMYGRSDLEAHSDFLMETFMDVESPQLKLYLAPGTVKANYDNPNNSVLRRHVEGLLLSRDDKVKALSQIDKFQYTYTYLSSHLRLSGSVLESIQFVESFRQQHQLRAIHWRDFWNDCASQFRAGRYFSGEEVSIVRHLIAHTDESLRAKDGSEKEVKRLAKIWAELREQHAYDEAVRHADESDDEMIQEAYDQIIAEWLAKEE